MRIRGGTVPVFLLFLLPLTGAAQRLPKDNSCITCHSDYWDDMKGSIHSQNQIYCNRCHGGDPTKADEDQAMNPNSGYIGVPDKKQLVTICGSCHADAAMMNFYEIPTDQLALYKTSIHGKRLFEDNDEHIAGCSDCHGYHDVVSVKDPDSPVYPLNVPKTCNHCHGNKRVMSQYGLPTDIFETYKNSVHGRALFEKKDISVAECARCHGSHGAVPPGVKEVSATCGKCHLTEKKDFMESPHGNLHDKNFFECISCHGFHGVQTPSATLYDRACVKCHTPDSKEFELGQKLKGMINDAEAHWKAAQMVVKQASIQGIFVDEETLSLEQAKTSLIEMAPQQHTLSISKTSKLHQKVVSTADEIEKSIRQKRQTLRWRKVSLIPLWGFILIMITALWIRFKQLKKETK